MKELSTQQFLELIQQISDYQPGAVSLDTSLTKLERWDSLAILDFIATADERCGVEIVPGKLKECKTVGDLAKLLGSQISQ
jgi:acyl carrier protein